MPDDFLRDKQLNNYESEVLHVADDTTLTGSFDEIQETVTPKPERIIFADQAIAEALKRAIEVIDPEGNTSIIMIETPTANASRSDEAGLDFALDLAKNQHTIILSGWNSIAHYADNPKWQAVMAYPNVFFTRLPFALNDLRELINKAQEDGRPFDQLAIDLLSIEMNVSMLGVLKHNLGHALNDSTGQKMTEWLKLAESVFGEKSQEELIEATQNADLNQVKSELAGKYYPDLFVDIEGTLFDENGEPNQKVLDLIKLTLELKRRPVTIWSGGDVKTLQSKVRALGLSCKVTSKQFFKDVEAETVVDDMTKEEFESTYGITAKNFININDLN